jgi:hypothetical protein
VVDGFELLGWSFGVEEKRDPQTATIITFAYKVLCGVCGSFAGQHRKVGIASRTGDISVAWDI